MFSSESYATFRGEETKPQVYSLSYSCHTASRQRAKALSIRWLRYHGESPIQSVLYLSEAIKAQPPLDKSMSMIKGKILQVPLVQRSPCLRDPEWRHLCVNFIPNIGEVPSVAKNTVDSHKKTPPSGLSLYPLPSFHCEHCQWRVR